MSESKLPHPSAEARSHPVGLVQHNTAMLHHRIALTMHGHMFQEMVRIGMAGALPLPVGRAGTRADNFQETRLMGPAEVVARASELTKLAFAEMETNGWVIEMPSFDQLVSDYPAQSRVGFGSE